MPRRDFRHCSAEEVGTVETQEACCVLIQRFVPKEELRDLLRNEEYYDEVVTRLKAVGLELVDSPYCSYYGVRFQKHMAVLDQAFSDWNTDGVKGGRELGRLAKAVLALLWGLLIAPQISGQSEGSEADGGTSGVHTVTLQMLYENYKGKGVRKQALKNVLTRLRNLQFISAVKKDTYCAGPGLYIYLDHREMYATLQSAVIRHKVSQLRERVQHKEGATDG